MNKNPVNLIYINYQNTKLSNKRVDSILRTANSCKNTPLGKIIVDEGLLNMWYFLKIHL